MEVNVATSEDSHNNSSGKRNILFRVCMAELNTELH